MLMNKRIMNYYLREKGFNPIIPIILSVFLSCISALYMVFPSNNVEKTLLIIIVTLQEVGFSVVCILSILYRKYKTIHRNFLSAVCFFSLAMTTGTTYFIMTETNCVFKFVAILFSILLATMILIIMMLKKEKFLLTNEDNYEEEQEKLATFPLSALSLLSLCISYFVYKACPDIVYLLAIVAFGWLCSYYIWFAAKQIMISKNR